MKRPAHSAAVIRTPIPWAPVAAAALFGASLGGCTTCRTFSSGSCADDGASVVVLAAPSDETKALAFDETLADPALAGRLDASLGAAPRPLVLSDETGTVILDQQFTWNGRIHDSYVNSQRTYRRSAR